LRSPVPAWSFMIGGVLQQRIVRLAGKDPEALLAQRGLQLQRQPERIGDDGRGLLGACKRAGNDAHRAIARLNTFRRRDCLLAPKRREWDFRALRKGAIAVALALPVAHEDEVSGTEVSIQRHQDESILYTNQRLSRLLRRASSHHNPRVEGV